jgi:hypothetical protein
MLVIIDNALSKNANEIAIEQFKGESTGMSWVDGSLLSLLEHKSALSECLSHASKYFDLSNMVGVELWSHNGTRPEWHIDKDEILFARTNKITTPICSIVYYGVIENLTNGRFITESESILPKTNRLIAFSPMLLHSVEEYTGTRLSIAINPWTTRPETYK